MYYTKSKRKEKIKSTSTTKAKKQIPNRRDQAKHRRDQAKQNHIRRNLITKHNAKSSHKELN